MLFCIMVVRGQPQVSFLAKQELTKYGSLANQEFVSAASVPGSQGQCWGHKWPPLCSALHWVISPTVVFSCERNSYTWKGTANKWTPLSPRLELASLSHNMSNNLVSSLLTCIFILGRWPDHTVKIVIPSYTLKSLVSKSHLTVLGFFQALIKLLRHLFFLMNIRFYF